jgi:hypothetical protein
MSISPKELREILCPLSDTLIPINELTSVLQQDLSLPVTRQDQITILKGLSIYISYLYLFISL